MTKLKVQNAAYLRGIRFTGVKSFRNKQVGYAYEFYSPNGMVCFQADSLEAAYKKIMKYPKIRKG